MSKKNEYKKGGGCTSSAVALPVFIALLVVPVIPVALLVTPLLSLIVVAPPIITALVVVVVVVVEMVVVVVAGSWWLWNLWLLLVMVVAGSWWLWMMRVRLLWLIERGSGLFILGDAASAEPRRYLSYPFGYDHSSCGLTVKRVLYCHHKRFRVRIRQKTNVFLH
jgi:hypothetical protein